MKQLSKRTTENGFTLIELLVSMSVTITGLLGAMAMHKAVLRGNDQSARGAQATALAHSLLEELRSARIDDMLRKVTGEATLPAAMPYTANLSTAVTPTQNYERSITLSHPGGDAGLIHIRAEIRWTDDNAPPGANGTGPKDHKLALEVIRTRSEAF